MTIVADFHGFMVIYPNSENKVKPKKPESYLNNMSNTLIIIKEVIWK